MASTIPKGKVRIQSDGKLLIFCKGCQTYHGIIVDPNDSRAWGFNGDYDKPTITPSILVEGMHRCHSYVTDGKMQYLSDCSHKLAGQTVDLDEEVEW